MPHKHVELSKTGVQGRPHDDHEHFKIQRLNDSLPTDKSHYLFAAIAELTVGTPIPAHYPGPTVTYVIEGELHVKDDSNPDEVTKLVAGDVIHIDHDSHNTFTTPNKTKFIGVSYSPSHLYPEDYVKK